MTVISRTTFSNAFSSMQILDFLFEFHWILFPRVQLTMSEHWFGWWLPAEQATSHYPTQYWPRSLTHICGTRSQSGSEDIPRGQTEYSEFLWESITWYKLFCLCPFLYLMAKLYWKKIEPKYIHSECYQYNGHYCHKYRWLFILYLIRYKFYVAFIYTKCDITWP